MRRVPVVCTLVAVTAAPAAADDAIKVAPANYAVVAGNARVRVLRATCRQDRRRPCTGITPH